MTLLEAGFADNLMFSSDFANGALLKRNNPAMGYGAPTMTAEEQNAMVDEAHRQGVRVACTAHAGLAVRQSIEAGCDSYLSKPLPVTELVELVHTYEEKYKKAPVAIPVVPITTAVPAAPTAPPVTTASRNAPAGRVGSRR